MDKEMRRLDACIDACAGISTEALESGAIRELVEAAEWAVFQFSESFLCKRLKAALTKLEQPK